MKDAAFTMFAWAGLKPGLYYESGRGEQERDVILPLVQKSPVDLWIQVGNKMREVYGDIWIDAALRSIANLDVIIITDLRFPNEAERVQEFGGLCYKVTNSRAAIRDSVSDRALDNWGKWNGFIDNEGTIGDLNNKMDELVVQIMERHRGK